MINENSPKHDFLTPIAPMNNSEIFQDEELQVRRSSDQFIRHNSQFDLLQKMSQDQEEQVIQNLFKLVICSCITNIVCLLVLILFNISTFSLRSSKPQINNDQNPMLITISPLYVSFNQNDNLGEFTIHLFSINSLESCKSNIQITSYLFPYYNSHCNNIMLGKSLSVVLLVFISIGLLITILNIVCFVLILLKKIKLSNAELIIYFAKFEWMIYGLGYAIYLLGNRYYNYEDNIRFALGTLWILFCFVHTLMNNLTMKITFNRYLRLSYRINI